MACKQKIKEWHANRKLRKISIKERQGCRRKHLLGKGTTKLRKPSVKEG
jgi:hypothetical protein